MKKIKKGDFGYTVSHRKGQMIKFLIYVSITLAVFLLGLAVTKKTENLLSVVAVVGVLPCTKELIGVIMSFKRKPMDAVLYRQISEKAEGLEQIYELLFTTSETSYPVEAVVIEGRDVICYTLDQKCNTAALQKHLYKLLNANDYKENVKVFTDLKKFLDRTGDLTRREKEEIPYKPHERYPELNRDELVKHTLLALSI